jgi:REP-associated tyrosine transposase
MARPLRLHVPDVPHHVIARGNAKQAIFLEDADYHYFLQLLATTTERFGVRCLSYCLMKNHYHALFKPSECPLSRMLQQLHSAYCQWFNRRHDRIGHVLHGRYKSLVVEHGDYLLRVTRYMALNPVAAGYVSHPSAWTWTAYRALAGLEDPTFLAVDVIWKEFHPTDQRLAQQRFATFVATEESVIEPRGPMVFGSESFAHQLDPWLEPHRDDLELLYDERFASRPSLHMLLGDVIGRDALIEAMRDAHITHAYTLRQIGDFLSQHPTTVWRRIRESTGCGAKPGSGRRGEAGVRS